MKQGKLINLSLGIYIYIHIYIYVYIISYIHIYTYVCVCPIKKNCEISTFYLWGLQRHLGSLYECCSQTRFLKL